MADTIRFRTDLIVNEHVIPLNDFIQNYIGTVLFGIVSVLGAIPEEVVLVMDDTMDIEIYADNKKIEVRKRFVKDIVGSTLRGLSHPWSVSFSSTWYNQVKEKDLMIFFNTNRCAEMS